MQNRRQFITSTLAAGSAAALYPVRVFGSRYKTAIDSFGVHDFISKNPEAVFIMRTNVDVKTNAEEKVQAGKAFSQSVFVPLSQEEGGVPLTHRVAIKPNLTWAQKTNKKATLEGCRGIVTDPEFVEGVIEGMKMLGLPGGQFYTRDKWSYSGSDSQLDFTGYSAMSERTGADIGGAEQSTKAQSIGSEYVVWKEVPNGVFFVRIPYLWPINSPDSFLINISKFKAHGMGITLCAKNLQGSIATPYVSHCSGWGADMKLISGDVVPNTFATIKEYYDRHVADGIPRWDKPSGTISGINMETWVHRCLDNNSTLKPNLHVVEGVYGRDGNFVDGPGPGDLAQDFMSNIIIFGKNPFNVDIIGHWLAGHEPGNFGLFHIAIERGLSTRLNPMDIPVYEWKADGSATLTPLTSFDRTPLLTYYMQRNYNGQDEAYWHMADEPFDYPPIQTRVQEQTKPSAIVLHQNHPNPFNPTTSIEYVLPNSGYVRLEIFNMRGQVVDVLVNGYRNRGSHMAVWNMNNHAAGTYLYRLRMGDYTETRKMTLLK